MKEFEFLSIKIETEKEFKKASKLLIKLGYEYPVGITPLSIKYIVTYNNGRVYCYGHPGCASKKIFNTIKEFKKYVKSKETKKGKLTIVVSKNYKDLFKDVIGLPYHFLLNNDTIEDIGYFIDLGKNVTIYTDKKDTEMFKKLNEKLFGKFEVKLMDKEELVSGWYNHSLESNKTWLMYYDFENGKRYGFHSGGKWHTDNEANDHKEFLIKADINEVEERLKEEAVKRGFKDGIKVRNHQVGDRELINFSLESIKYSEKYHIGIYLTTGTGTWLMMDGVWAEIVEEKLTLENIQVDCSELTSEQIENMKRVVVENGYELWDDAIAFYIIKDDKYFQYNTGTFCILTKMDDLTTITYDKFMELFDTKKVMYNGSSMSNVKEGEVKSIEELRVEHKEQSFNEKCEQDYKDVCKAYGISEEDAKPKGYTFNRSSEYEFYKGLDAKLNPKLNPKGLCVEWMEEFNKIPGHVFDALKFRTPQGQSMLKVDSNQVNTTFNPQSHYNNEFGSLYKMSEKLGLNAYEFDILKRVVRCRKKGQFEEDLQKTKDLIDLYLIESKK